MNLYIHTKTYTQCALRAHARRSAASARQQRETSSDVFHGDESNNQSREGADLRAHARRSAASARQQRETSSDVFHGDESNNQSNRENDPRNVALLIRNCK